MDLRPHIENLQHQLVVAAGPGGEDARALAERLVGPLEAAMRLALQDALATAVEEITCELAPGSVELRLRGQEPEFAVTVPPPEAASAPPPERDEDPGMAGWPAAGPEVEPLGSEAEESELVRINLRMPEHLKARVESAARREGLSVNTWLVRAAAGALQRTDPTQRFEPRTPLGNRRHTGWAR